MPQIWISTIKTFIIKIVSGFILNSFFIKNFTKGIKMTSTSEHKTYKIKSLTLADLPDIMTLQNEIWELLEQENHTGYILNRSSDEYHKMLSKETTLILGMYDGDKLIAQSIVDLPKSGEKRDLDEFMSTVSNDKIAIYKAVFVTPSHRGQGLMQQMLIAREKIALKRGRTIAISQIAQGNKYSWGNAQKHGMEIALAANDPYDNEPVYYMLKYLPTPQNAPEKTNLSKRTTHLSR